MTTGNTKKDEGNRHFALVDNIKINILGFSLTALSTSIGSIILPLLILDLVTETQKNTYLGLLVFTGLGLAIIVQPLAGAISDHSRSRFGRRRPFIFIGILLLITFAALIGIIGSYVTLFTVFCLMQVSANIAQASWQGFIPDLVPKEKRGQASGLKGLLEILGAITGIQIVGYLISGRFMDGMETGLWSSLGALSFLLLLAMLVTLTVSEQPGSNFPERPFRQGIIKTFRLDITAKAGFVSFLLARLLFLLPLAMLRIFILYFLLDVIRVDDPAMAVANLTAITGFCLLATVYPAGWLSDRVGRRPIMAVSCFIGAVGILFLLVSNSYSWVMLAGGLLGVATGGFISANWAMATDLVGKGEEARYLGLTNLATAGASALAGLSGLLIDFLNNYTPGSGYQVILIAGLISFITSSIISTRIKVG